MAVTLVIAWNSDMTEPLAIKRVVNKREAKEVAEELYREYQWSPRISFYEEVDFNATEAGMTEEEKRKALEQLNN